MIRNHGAISSIFLLFGNYWASCEVAYSASRAELIVLQKPCKELAPSNIRVNAIACGLIDTDMNSWLSMEEKNELLDQIPLMKMGSSKDVANLCIYLASDKANYMTGQIISLDGGMI